MRNDALICILHLDSRIDSADHELSAGSCNRFFSYPIWNNNIREREIEKERGQK